jgi:AcrR family transcriptional regulator
MRTQDGYQATALPADAAAGTTAGAASPRRPGRPRSEQAEQALLEATIEAIGECGIDGVRCEDVAARAGVGKATLYRRWPGKEDLLIAAFAALKRPLPQPRGESARDDLIAMLEVVAADADDPRYAQHYALLHAEGERYPRLVALYKERVMEPRREAMRSVLRRGAASGELRPDLDIEVAVLALTGAVIARGKHDAVPAEPDFATRVVDEVLRGIAVLSPLASGRSGPLSSPSLVGRSFLAPSLLSPRTGARPLARGGILVQVTASHPARVMCAVAARGDAWC